MLTRQIFNGTSGIVAACVLAASAYGQSTSSLDSLCMYGINKHTGRLGHYDFTNQQYQTIGNVHRGLNEALLGIDAAAYVPGLANIFAFWYDADEGQSRLVYVNCKTAKATPMGQALGSGVFTGATVVLNNGSDEWLTPLLVEGDIAGTLNINPNNSPDNEFTLTTAGGQVITRDDLHHSGKLDPDGVFYEGPAVNIRVKPKGNGDQNTLIFNGVPYSVSNSQTYLFSGQMTVRVYNDHIHHNGKAMGHWWIEVLDGTAIIDGGNDTQTITIPGEWFVVAVQGVENMPYASRMVIVDHRTGEMQLLMQLDNVYDSLGWHSGKVFYATKGNELYRLRPEDGSETLLGTMNQQYRWALEFAGDQLMSFDAAVDLLHPVKTDEPSAVMAGHNVSMEDLGSIVFVPWDKDPLNKPVGFD